MTKTPPYGFVPVPLRNGKIAGITASPVFHDRKRPVNAPQEELFSGELLCTLRALTPLIAANDQYEASEVNGKVAENGKIKLPQSWGINIAVPADKHILEPLRLACGRVAISGTAIKGMVRASLAALLGAPMERVAERVYSYRPNLDVADGHLVREARPAVVDRWDKTTRTLELRMLPKSALSGALFVRHDAIAALGPMSVGRPLGRVVDGVEVERRLARGRSDRVIASNGNRCPELQHCVPFHYIAGLDGGGTLASAHSESLGHAVAPESYTYVLVGKDYLDKATPVTVPKPIIQAHDRTIDHLSAGVDTHPLSPRYLGGTAILNAKAAFAKRKDFLPKHLIYIEIEWDDDAGDAEDGCGFRIVSLGHNYRYRWRFSDSVRTRGDRTRPELTTAPDEIPDGEGRPRKLSGARLLFGYLSNDDYGTAKLGTGPYERLAGRLAVNIAVERDRERQNRFVENGKAIPLKILAQPRPSAYEQYLKQPKQSTPPRLRKFPERRNEARFQDRAIYFTYGDIAEEKSGELAGRKFYYHQPQAAKDPTCYRADDKMGDKQAALARFVSAPGVEFGFCLRFEDLREWELGALLVALDPARLEGSATETDTMNPVFALKIGHGRPLGLGSVAVHVDKCVLTRTDGNMSDGSQTCTNAIEAFRQKLKSEKWLDDESALKCWLDMHRFSDQPRREYPKAADRKGHLEIFNHYTNNRRDHSKARRQKQP